MHKNQLQKTAEQVLELEIRIFHWQGSLREWNSEVSRLGVAIDNLFSDAKARNDPAREAFLKGLQSKVYKCRDYVANRAHWMKVRCDPGSSCESNHAIPGVLTGVLENQDKI